MPKAARKKTASALKRSTLGLLALVFIGLISMLAFAGRGSEVAACPIALPRQELGAVSLANSFTSYDCIQLETVSTPAARQQGLSGRDHLADTQGMLFVFEQPQQVCMWMKDMQFSIDIIWLDAHKNILKIQENVHPNTYPQLFCMDQTAYVIELQAGVAERSHLKIGQRLQF